MGMDNGTLLIMIGCIFAVASLYSSVGHAGASGYIAVMTLFNLQAQVIKPTALILNVFVSAIAAFQFLKAGHFSWKIFWPFALPAIPMAFLGGYVNIPTHVFKVLIGVTLLISALRFLFPEQKERVGHPPRITVALPIGAGLGLMSGLTGTGGGIFLTPLMLLLHWAPTKVVAGISSLFIFANSLSGLIGNWTKTRHLPEFALPFLLAALAGGVIGSYFGSKKLSHTVIKRLLALVLMIAGIKLVSSQ
jgi:uncharacterized protein